MPIEAPVLGPETHVRIGKPFLEIATIAAADDVDERIGKRREPPEGLKDRRRRLRKFGQLVRSRQRAVVVQKDDLGGERVKDERSLRGAARSTVRVSVEHAGSCRERCEPAASEEYSWLRSRR